jgi:hypothetical protein
LNTCPLCHTTTNQPLCKKCAREWVKDLHEIYDLIPRVEALARKEEHMGGRGQGRVNPAFATTPVSLSAMDYLQTVYESLDVLATDCRVPHSERTPWRVIVKRLMVLGVGLGLGWTPVESRKLTRRVMLGLRVRTTPVEERLIVGRCLNPVCGRELVAVKGQSEVECHACGSNWNILAVLAARREEVRVMDVSQMKRLITTPTGVTRWIRKKTNLRITRQAVSMWIRRGKMPKTKAIADGTYDFDRVELWDLVIDVLSQHVSI